MRIGVDLLRIDELDALSQRDWFLRWAYADEERGLARELGASRAREFLAGRFAGKEAAAKALGCGFAGGVRPCQIHIGRAVSGAPLVWLTGSAAARARDSGVTSVLLSITHKETVVAAASIAVTDPPSAGRWVAALAELADGVTGWPAAAEPSRRTP